MPSAVQKSSFAKKRAGNRPQAQVAAQVEAMRRFNRFYTQKIGVLEDGRLYAPFSLAETRVLYELAHRDRVTASDLVRELGLDAGYLSRMLRGFEKKGLVTRRPAPEDARQSLLGLTGAGRKTFAPLENESRKVLQPLLDRLDDAGRAELIGAMDTITRLLGGAVAQPARPAFVLRPHRPGDIGWMVQRHGELYSREYGFDGTFEALAAEVGAQFLRDYDPSCERGWIAELDSGERVGSVFLIRKSATVAKLRVLLVDPKARGLGIGAALVNECIAFARAKGYRKITLWTNSVLTAARAIYVKAGFKLVSSEKHRSFGQDLIGETWDLKL